MKRFFLFLILLALWAGNAWAGEPTYQWSVQYLVEKSEVVFGHSQKLFPRHNRGLALSADGHFLYAGYNHGFNHGGEVRKIDLREPDYERATVALLGGVLGKAIAVDDMGRVYITNNTSIKIYDPDLKQLLSEIKTNDCEGVGAVREKGPLGLRGALILYATERRNQTLKRWVLSEDGMTITAFKPDGLGGKGEVLLPESVSLRGLCIDPQERIWIADLEANRVYRVASDGREIIGMAVSSPIAITFDGTHFLVTRYMDRQIAILNEDMTIYGTLTVPWDQLKLDPGGEANGGALSGIVALPKLGFYVANEGGRTANNKSVYGRKGDNTGTVDGVLFMDQFEDDDDPILHAVLR